MRKPICVEMVNDERISSIHYDGHLVIMDSLGYFKLPCSDEDEFKHWLLNENHSQIIIGKLLLSNIEEYSNEVDVKSSIVQRCGDNYPKEYHGIYVHPFIMVEFLKHNRSKLQCTIFLEALTFGIKELHRKCERIEAEKKNLLEMSDKLNLDRLDNHNSVKYISLHSNDNCECWLSVEFVQPTDEFILATYKFPIKLDTNRINDIKSKLLPYLRFEYDNETIGDVVNLLRSFKPIWIKESEDLNEILDENEEQFNTIDSDKEKDDEDEDEKSEIQNQETSIKSKSNIKNK